jgi:uncharacterized protein YceK
MRWIFLPVALGLMAGCSSISQYDANSGQAPTSNLGSQGGDGVQTSIWSTDPAKKTILGPSTPPPSQ